MKKPVFSLRYGDFRIGKLKRKEAVDEYYIQKICDLGYEGYASEVAFGPTEFSSIKLDLPIIVVDDDEMWFDVMRSLKEFPPLVVEGLKKYSSDDKNLITEFVLESPYGEDELGLGDFFYIDTVGYDYPRYKASAVRILKKKIDKNFEQAITL